MRGLISIVKISAHNPNCDSDPGEGTAESVLRDQEQWEANGHTSQSHGGVPLSIDER